MARREDRIGRELSSFFKAAAASLDEVKDTVVRGGQAGKATLDAQLLKRQREKALAKLGEVLLDEVARGAVLPASCDALVVEVKDLEAQIARAQGEADKLWGSEAGGKPAPVGDAHGDDHDDDHDDE